MKGKPLLGGITTQNAFRKLGGYGSLVFGTKISRIVSWIFKPPWRPFGSDLDLWDAVPAPKFAFKTRVL
jgi:hypothetical protein